jgi:chlorobactene glucosyltransferase
MVYHSLVLVVLVLTLVNLLVNLCLIQSLGRAPKPTCFPRVSILVPARNEAHRIGPCATSLKAQDYPDFEVLILNDNSEDRTEEVLRELGYGGDGPQLRLLTGGPLPVGWTGKAWACHQLALASTGEYLLFTDADTVHLPGTLRAAIAQAQQTRADLLTIWPREITGTWSEKLVIPLLFLLAIGIFPFALFELLQNFPRLAAVLPRNFLRALGAANGQFILFKKSAYAQIGGHEQVRAHLVEDVALGREVSIRMGEGMRLVTCDAKEFVSCRMYECFSELWEGFTKNLRAVFEGSLGMFLLTGLVQFACFFLPFVLIALPFGHRRMIASQIALIYLLRVILTVRFNTSWFGCLFHPFAHFLSLLIGLNSWRKSAGKGVSWKGRVYQVR